MYKVNICFRCDQYDYYCTDDVEFKIEELSQLQEKIEEIERRNTILVIQVIREQIMEEIMDRFFIIEYQDWDENGNPVYETP